MNKEHRFMSRYYTGYKKKYTIINWIISILICIVALLFLVKIIAGDFFDYGSSVFVCIIVGLIAFNNSKSKIPCYEDTEARLTFADSRIIINYDKINLNGTNESYSDEITINYKDIISVEYGKSLSCFRVVGESVSKKIYKEKETIDDMCEENFIYVYDDSVTREIIDDFNKYYGIEVVIMKEAKGD